MDTSANMSLMTPILKLSVVLLEWMTNSVMAVFRQVGLKAFVPTDQTRTYFQDIIVILDAQIITYNASCAQIITYKVLIFALIYSFFLSRILFGVWY